MSQKLNDDISQTVIGNFKNRSQCLRKSIVQFVISGIVCHIRHRRDAINHVSTMMITANIIAVTVLLINPKNRTFIP